jgi:hypothetical protein
MQASQRYLDLQTPYSWIVENLLFHQYSIAKVGQLNLKAEKSLVQQPFSTQAQKHIYWETCMFRSLGVLKIHPQDFMPNLPKFISNVEGIS